MRLRVKTLAGAVHTVEVTEADDIAALRDRVALATGFELDGLRLLHAGELLIAGPIRHTRLMDGDFIVAVVAKQAKPKAAAPPPDVKMTDAAPPKKDKKEEKDKDKESSSEADLKPAAVASSPEQPVPVESPMASEQLRAQLQDLMMGLLDLAGGRQNNAPPPVQPPPPAEVVVDPALIQQLVDMGFAQNRARKALILSRLNLQRAMEWLLEHENDPDIDAPIPPGAPIPKPAAGAVDGGDAQAVQRLQEMGFSAEDVQQALRATNFNYEAACAWLLGDRDGAAAAAAGDEQGEEEEEEVDDSNPMIAAILNNPQIQSSLTPRVVQAFQAMMENPGSTAEYINDPEVGPVILQVLQIVRGGNAGGAANNNGANPAAAAAAAAPAAPAAGSNPPSPAPPKGPNPNPPGNV